MKILYSFFIGMMMAGGYSIITMLLVPGGGDPAIEMFFFTILFVVGCIIGWIDFDRKQRKKKEEEERQAEQDRTNELMREYLEKKLREEDNEKN